MSGDTTHANEFFQKSKLSLGSIFGKNSYKLALAYHTMAFNYKLVDDLEGFEFCSKIVDDIMKKMNFKETYPVFYVIVLISKFMDEPNVTFIIFFNILVQKKSRII